jgi:hypothetical protein
MWTENNTSRLNKDGSHKSKFMQQYIILMDVAFNEVQQQIWPSKSAKI